jgi:hypothetical protein
LPEKHLQTAAGGQNSVIVIVIVLFILSTNQTKKGWSLKNVFLFLICLSGVLGCSSDKKSKSDQIINDFLAQSARTGEVFDFSGNWRGSCFIKFPDIEADVAGTVMIVNTEQDISILNVSVELGGESIEFFNNEHLISINENTITTSKGKDVGTIGSDGITVFVKEDKTYVGFVLEKLSLNNSGFSLTFYDGKEMYEMNCASLARL